MNTIIKQSYKQLCCIFSCILLLAACHPPIGTPFYPRSAAHTAQAMYITSITIDGIPVTPVLTEKPKNDLHAKELFSAAKEYVVTVPYTCKELFDEHIIVEAVSSLVRDEKLRIKIHLNGDGVPLVENIGIPVTVKIQDVENIFATAEKVIKVTRQKQEDSPVQTNNPKDKNGNEKYIITVETKTEDRDPFEYYKPATYFPAENFDKWILFISDFDNSTYVPSYKFQQGSWSGTPESYAGPDFGSSFTKMSNVKFYRYKTRTERWDGRTPSNYNEEKEKRFYFYRFTATGSVSLDNSMFCVDTHSKFIFNYSDPADISSLKVPSSWMDYSDPTSRKHQQFNEPFYLSDPVGYVKDTGEVVLYSWSKDNITNTLYTAQKNTAFTAPAQRKPNGAGYSPYRNKVHIEWSDVTKAENPDYTAAEPVIITQPNAVRIKPGTGEAVFTVKAVPAPEGEELSYQWYEHTVQSNTGGTLIQDAQDASYTPDTSQEKDCYVYCVITNTNTKNQEKQQTASYAVKLLIKDGPLPVDAEQPRLKIQPKDRVIPYGAQQTITLNIEAASPDGGTLSYQWYSSAADNTTNGQAIAEAVAPSYTFTPKTDAAAVTYYYCVVTNKKDAVDGKKTAFIASRAAKVEVEELYQVYFAKEGKGGSITALCGTKVITTGDYVKKGTKVTFFAEAASGYEVEKWTGVTNEAANKTTAASMIVSKKETVKVYFREIPDTRRLIITAKKLENKDLCCKYSGWNNYNKDHAYFVYNFRVQIFDTGNYDADNYQSLWSINNGVDAVKNLTQVSKIRKLMIGESITSSNTTVKEFTQKPDSQSFRLDTKLVKYDKTLANAAADEQYLSGYDQSVVEFVYNKQKDEWICKKAAIEGNFTIPNTTAEIDETFVLKRGETKDFTINYYVDNAGNYAVGTAIVTYTLKWE